MLHTLWVTETAFEQVEDYIRCHESAKLYIMHAQQDLLSLRYVILVECSDRDSTYLRLLEH